MTRKKNMIKFAGHKAFMAKMGLVIIILIIMVVFSNRQTTKANNTASWVAHTQEVLFHTERLLLTATNVETGARAFLLTGLRQFRETFETSKNEARSELKNIRELTADNASQKPRLDSLESRIEQRIGFCESFIHLQKGTDMRTGLQFVQQGGDKLYLNRTAELIGQMQQEENRLLSLRRNDNSEALALQHKVFIYFVFIILGLLTFIFWKERQSSAYREKEKSGKLFRNLLESAPDAMVIVNEKGLITLTNQQTASLFGYHKTELVGKSVEVLIPEELRLIHTHHREQFSKQPRVRSMGAGMELMAVKKGGAKFPVEISLSQLETDEGVLVSASIRDISEKKKAQEQVELLSKQINQSNDAFIITNASRKIIDWNLGAEKLYGFTKEEALAKDSNELLRTVITQDQINSLLKEIARINYWKGELKRQTKSGKEIYVHTSSSTLRDGEGLITGYLSVSFDITEQKILREEVSHLATLVEQSTEAIISRGMNRRIIGWNRGAEKLFGYSKEEAIGKTVSDLGFARFTVEDVSLIEKQVSKSGTWRAEMNYYNRDGSSFFGAATANGFKNELGEVSAIIFIIRDITERKKLEDDLKKLNEELEDKVIARTEQIYKNEKRFRALIENSNDLISLNDEALKIFYRSPSTSRVTGWTDHDRIGVTGTDNVHPNDKTEAARVIRESICHPGKPVHFLFRSLHKDGHYLWLEGVINNLLHDEDIKAIVFNFRDVTERIEAEEKLIKSEKIYKTIASSIPGSVICLLDRDYRYLLIEGDMLKKLGYSKNQLLGNKAEDVLNPEIFSGVKKEFQKVLEGETVSVESSKDGYDLISRFIPLKDGNDKVYAIMTVAIDITELKNAQRGLDDLNQSLEEKITNSTEQLRKSIAEMEAFSYSVSHDLRSPLRGITGFATMLEEDYGSKLEPEGRRITSIIKRNAERMGQLIDDLLNFSRMGRQEIIKSTIQTGVMVREIINELKVHGGAVECEWIIPALPDSYADQNTIRQVWINLVSNAIKYSGKVAHRRIEIGSFMREGQISFFIKDNGAGFDQKYSHKLFHVFQRLHGNNEFAGTGVGLAIVEKIIFKHEGKVWAEGEVGKGATFYFSLPIKPNGL